MTEKGNKGKGFLKEKLGDYRVDPPDSVWNSIASHLAGRRGRRLIIISLSAAASLTLAITLGINFFGPDVQEQRAVTPPERAAGTLEERVSQALEEMADEPSGQEKEPAAPSEKQIYEEIAVAVTADQVERTVVQEPGIGADPVSLPLSESTSGDQDPAPDPTAEPQAGDGPQDPGRDDPVLPGIPEPEEEITADPLPEMQEEPSRDPRWIVGASLSPLYSFRDAEASAMSGASGYDSGPLAYAGGIHVSYRAASRLAVESGIFYNKMGISIGAPGIQLFNEAVDLSPLGQEAGRASIKTITNSVGNIVALSGEVYVNNYKINATSPVNAFTDNTFAMVDAADEGIRQHLEYLELPFNLRYTLIDRTIELQLVGGMSTNFLVNNYVTMETPEGPTDIGYLTNIRSINYSGNAGIGMIYHLHEQISLRVEPRFRYFLNSINDATLPSTRPYTLGVYTGLSYIF